jgi:hypothetical protein
MRESAGGGSEAAREIDECGLLFFPLAVDCDGSRVVDGRGMADLQTQAVSAENQ